MQEMVWINGTIMPLPEARVNVEDRGYQFADGVYEVIRLYNARPFALVQHLERLERSADGIQLELPVPVGRIADHMNELLQYGAPQDGMIYLQLTRGTAPRNHLFPRVPPNLLFYVRKLPPAPPAGEGEGVKLLPVPEDRWKRCWIKAIALLPNILAKNQAALLGYDEAVFVEEGVVSEGASSNLFAVVDGVLVTAPTGERVLPGITRMLILDLARELGVPVIQRPLLEQEIVLADELFISSTTREINWARRWGDREVGQGRCGPVARALHKALQQRVRSHTEGPHGHTEGPDTTGPIRHGN